MSLDMNEMAEAYSAAPPYDGKLVHLWREVADVTWTMASDIRRRMRVVETYLPVPYATAEDMFRDLELGTLTVSYANCNHPVWSQQENVAFRIVHDVLGHYAAHVAGAPAGFDWTGECGAWAHHVRCMPGGVPLTHLSVLSTEILGQGAYALKTGQFGPQKIVLL